MLSHMITRRNFAGINFVIREEICGTLPVLLAPYTLINRPTTVASLLTAVGSLPSGRV